MKRHAHLGSQFHQLTQAGHRLAINGNMILFISDGIAIVENAWSYCEVLRFMIFLYMEKLLLREKYFI